MGRHAGFEEGQRLAAWNAEPGGTILIFDVRPARASCQKNLFLPGLFYKKMRASLTISRDVVLLEPDEL
jgi:hypothetical protein